MSEAMTKREAACHCGQLRLAVSGDPLVVSICHCLACQRRTGSAFGMQATFRPDQVEVVGRFNDFARISDEADRREHLFHFCPDCESAAKRHESRGRSSSPVGVSRPGLRGPIAVTPLDPN